MAKNMNSNDETMALQEFKKHLSYVVATILRIVQTNDISEKEFYKREVIKCLKYIHQNFADKDMNMMRYFSGLPCIYKHPITQKQILIKIPDGNIEGLYYFLRFCMKINRFHWIDEDLQVYVAYLLSDSYKED